MSGIVADTHAVLWYLIKSPKLSRKARAALDRALATGDPIHVSTISVVEIVYLTEKGRLPAETLEQVTSALRDKAQGVREVPVDSQIAEALRRVARDEVPDMPDRIIAATGLHLSVPVVSRDRRIRASNIETIW